MTQPVLINGSWQAADSSSTFQADNPVIQEKLPEHYPVSSWRDCDQALAAAAEAFQQLQRVSGDQIATFLEAYATRIEARSEEICAAAQEETALPQSPRLADVELPRTTNQLRLAAVAAREGTWKHPVIDTAADIRSCYESLGPVAVFGPNNFPLAFNSVSGGDFAAAIASGNPVIAKANSSHPATTRLLAEEAFQAVTEAGLPPATVQLIYRTSHEDGERMVADPRIGATGYTGSRSAGLTLKSAADRAGKPIYLELSSVNPVVILPGAIAQRGEELASEFTTSCLMGTGQFCTNPGLVILLESEATEAFIDQLQAKFEAAPVGTLLSGGVAKSLEKAIGVLIESGALPVTGSTSGGGTGYSHSNTLLRINGQHFLNNPGIFQTEAFGNASLLVVADDASQAALVISELEGNLTGCIYSDTAGSDDAIYDQLAAPLRQLVGRLLNDKMPTGVAVSPAMNHGGPYPATGHPGFTAVGIPASLTRFTRLACYDGVRPARLPACLQDANPSGMWRQVDGNWSQASL
jgi:2,5-dioxopentanoate dehydrogenase